MSLTVELRQLQRDHPNGRERERGENLSVEDTATHRSKLPNSIAHRIINHLNLILGFSLEIEGYLYGQDDL